MQIALVSAPVRTTSRPDGAQRAMEQVSCRPLSVVSEASAGHLKGEQLCLFCFCFY
jgi:hypothetical protein